MAPVIEQEEVAVHKIEALLCQRPAGWLQQDMFDFSAHLLWGLLSRDSAQEIKLVMLFVEACRVSRGMYFLSQKYVSVLKSFTAGWFLNRVGRLFWLPVF